ncbi:DUF5068 domain-containing protein [Alkalihalobacillus sp. LMS39]|uniref:DUF5068 domain-containing protein n=1 Tax=Alkalihalobacillus sp. LMS39 TaxID=2924032 RepID=UPI001FB364CE|nr:DUF5068 domain-containing protein [Alkalihalobacillus sp. LMS39]UOE93705.1 DUF5068 domain-containing protein [Alkalihalobacillus sp. LMS39]
MKKWLGIMSLSVALALTGCNSEETTKDEDKDVVDNEVEQPVSAEEEEQEEPTETEIESNDAGELNTYITEYTDGEVEIIFTNSNPNINYDAEGFKMIVEQYQIVHVTDMHASITSSFNDKNSGYIITAKVTIDNQTGHDAYYTTNTIIQGKDNYHSQMPRPNFVREEERLRPKSSDDVSHYQPGEKVTGLVSFTYSEEEFEELLQTNPKFRTGTAAANEDFSGQIGQDGVFDFPINEESLQALSERPDFIEDLIESNNYAEKTLLSETMDVNETKTLHDVEVTLEGFQVTEITPTESYEQSFEDFGDKGIVALTIQLNMNNKTDDIISAYGTSGILVVDDNRARYLSQGNLEPRIGDDLEAGKEAKRILVYLIRKDEFELYDKFEIEFGPIRDSQYQDVSKGETLTFELPN